MTLTREQKLEMMRTLNWDYATPYEDMLAVIEGEREEAAPFDRKKLFVRSLERIGWTYLVALWGIDAVNEMYTPEIRRRLWPPSRREDYDITFALLRGEPVSATRWGSEFYKSQRYRFFSNRGDCA
jgi:hypothetical protein